MRDDEENRHPNPLTQLGSTPSAPPEKPDLKRRILESKQRILSGMGGKYTGEETSRWLTHLEENPTSAEETIASGSLVDNSQLSMPALLDLLFDHLQRYSFELNKVSEDPDMKISVERPSSWHEKVEYMKKTRFMRGHLATRLWTFFVWAEELEADGYFIPTELMVGFSPSEDYEPYIKIKRHPTRSEDIAWAINGQILSSHEIPKLARRLITQLVKIANNEAAPDEKFHHATSDHVVEEEVVVDRSFESFLEGQNEFSHESGPPKESRSQKLKRLMTEAAQQEEADRANAQTLARANVGVTDRPARLAARAEAAAGNGPTNSSTSLPQAGQSRPFAAFTAPGSTAMPPSPGATAMPPAPGLPTPPGALGASAPPMGMPSPPGAAGMPTPPGTAGMPSPPGAAGMPPPPGAAGLPSPPGATGLPSPPGALGMPSPPGAAGMPSPPGAAGMPTPPGALASPPGMGAPPPGFGASSAPPGLAATPPGGFQPPPSMPNFPPQAAPSQSSTNPPGVLQPPPGFLSGPPGGFGSSIPFGSGPGASGSSTSTGDNQTVSSSQIQSVSSANNQAVSSSQNPAYGTSTGEQEASGVLRPPGALFGAPQERERVNSALLPEESGMHPSMAENAEEEKEPPSPWASLSLSASKAQQPTPDGAEIKPALSDVTRKSQTNLPSLKSLEAEAEEQASGEPEPAADLQLPHPSPFAPPPRLESDEDLVPSSEETMETLQHDPFAPTKQLSSTGYDDLEFEEETEPTAETEVAAPPESDFESTSLPEDGEDSTEFASDESESSETSAGSDAGLDDTFGSVDASSSSTGDHAPLTVQPPPAPEPYAPPSPEADAPPMPPAPAEAPPAAPRGLAGLVRKSILHDAAPPSPRDENRAPAVQVDFGMENEPEPQEEPTTLPDAQGKRPTLQSLLKPTHPEPPHTPAEPVTAPGALAAPPPPPAAPAPSAPPPMPSSAPAASLSSADASDIAKLVEDAQRHTLGNLSGIINELDRAMKTLQEAGVEAMQSGNFESVQLVMENTKRLKATRDRLTQLLDEISSV